MQKFQLQSAWIVVLTASLFFFYEFIQLSLFNSIDRVLMRDFHLDAHGLGQLASTWFYGNALCIFPAGYLLDRYSVKTLLMVATALSVVGTIVFATAKVAYIAGMGRFVVGMCAAFCFLSCIRLASRWFPPHRMATVTGVVVTMAMLGGLVAQTPFILLLQCTGSWRIAVLLDAILGLIIFIAITGLVQDQPILSSQDSFVDQHQLTVLGLWKCIRLVGFNAQNWLGGIYTALMNLPVFIFGGLWGIHYLAVVQNLSAVKASYATTVFFIGVLLGSPIFGLLSDYCGRRVLPMVIGSVLSLMVISVLLYSSNLPYSVILLLFFLIGFVTSSQVLSYPIIAELNPQYLTGTAMSVASFIIMTSGFVFLPLFSRLIQYSSGTRPLINGQHIYLAQDFHFALLILPIAFIVALLVTAGIQETYCRADQSNG